MIFHNIRRRIFPSNLFSSLENYLFRYIPFSSPFFKSFLNRFLVQVYLFISLFTYPVYKKKYGGIITYAFAVTSTVRMMSVDLHIGASVKSVQSSK